MNIFLLILINLDDFNYTTSKSNFESFRVDKTKQYANIILGNLEILYM